MNKKNIKMISMMLIICTSSWLMLFTSSLEGSPSEGPIRIIDQADIEQGIRASNYWNNFTFIHIKDNWSIAASHDWCSGDGSWGNPYIIENITINATNSPTGYGIFIEDSVYDYFIINNCTIHESSGRREGTSIKFENVNNGTVTNNNISESLFGMDIMEGNNNTIIGNILTNITRGILLFDIDNCTISNNTLINSTYSGIALTGVSPFIENFNNAIQGNNMTSGGIIISGGVKDLTTNIIDTTNTIAGRPIYIYINESGLNQDNFTNCGQIILNNCNDSLINHFNISNVEYGIIIEQCLGVNVTDMNISTIDTGIYLKESNDCIIRKNNCSNSETGIRDKGNNNTLIENMINYSSKFGILAEGSNTTIRANLMNGCGIVLSGNSKEILTSHEIDLQNEVNGKAVYYNKSSNYLRNSDFSDPGQIILVNCSHSIISGFNISGGSVGIQIAFSSNITMKNNDFSNNGYTGIYVYSGSYNSVIFNNTVNYNTEYGMYIYSYSENNSFIENVLENNGKNGLFAEYGDNNRFKGNNLSQNGMSNPIISGSNTGAGIYMRSCEGWNISGNAIINNTNGIYFSGSNTRYNNILENAIINNSLIGIQLPNGANNNVFYNNTFENNLGGNAHDIGGNQWDNGSLGNAWDDYAAQGGHDLNDDGIGDIPYNVSLDPLAQDRYPIFDDGDDLNPKINIIAPTNGQVINSIAPDFTIEINETNIDTMWYTIDGGVMNITFSVNETIDQNNWTVHADGPLTLTFYVNDTSGNVNSSSVSIVKDTVVPLLSINLPVNNSFWNERPTFNITQFDINGNSTWLDHEGTIIFLDNNSNNILEAGFWSGLSEGEHCFKVRANDTAGNINDTFIIILYKDTIKPNITINQPTLNQAVGRTAPNFNVVINETNTDTMWYSLNGGNNITFTINETVNQLQWQVLWDSLANNSVITITFHVNDSAGNWNSTSIMVLKYQASTPPAATTTTTTPTTEEPLDIIGFLTSVPGMITMGAVAGIIITTIVIKKGKSGKASSREKERIGKIVEKM